MKKRIALLLSLCLVFSLTAVPVGALDVNKGKGLLQMYYVDEISPEIMELETLEEVLAALNDPYTEYMSAEHYNSFMTTVNGDKVTGIGVSIETIFLDGYRILSILPNSPALEAGLEAGDRIIAVDGTTLTSNSDVQGMITGKEGTPVTISVIRQADGLRRDYTMNRRSVSIPIVTYDKEGTAGVIDCTSFGDSTIKTVQEALESLDRDVSLWVMDLRSNPGGTANAAAGSAGLFVGSAPMVYFRDGDGAVSYIYTLENCPDLTDKPLVVLLSPSSASGSELFAAAARDHGFGISVGQRSFGKGIAQTVFDETNTDGFFDGDSLKITTHRFYSPDGTTNHIVGVLPSLLVSEEHTGAVALLLSAPIPKDSKDFLKLELAGQTFYIDLAQALSEEVSLSFLELLEALPPSAVLSRGTGYRSWDNITPAKLAQELGLPYVGRTFSDLDSSPYRREIDTLAAYRLLSGYEDGTFRPEQKITRSEFCTMIAAALNLPANPSALTFSDTPADAWYAGYVSAMAARGFIAGYEDGTFRPDNTITYQEMITILSAAAAWCNLDGLELSRTELNMQDWLKYYHFDDWAQIPARNLAKLGARVDDLAPAADSSRQVAAALLCSFMEGINLIWD